MKKHEPPYGKLKQIRVVLLDVDGILTDGRIVLMADGSEIKSFHAHDGQGLMSVLHMGYEVALISSRASKVVAARAKELGINNVFQGVTDKLKTAKKFVEDHKYKLDECLYMGDDLQDLPLLRAAGFSATVPEAPEVVQECVDHVTRRGGGRGAVREVIELMLKIQGKWSGLVEEYLRGHGRTTGIGIGAPNGN